MRRAACALLALALLTGCSKDAKPDKLKPPTIDGVEMFEGLTHEHEPPASYPQTPPVGGNHSKAWLTCGVYDEPVPNVNAVHSMEHGAVWITYRPDLSEDERNAVRRLQGLKPEYVLISPYEGLPAKVVASTWGYQLKVDRVDDPRLAAFVKEYAGGGQGGEPGAPCTGGLSPEEAERFNASSGASP
ncbi:MAG TPA: DUF3105 domain-containing protein [Frankiaceae bacterium]|jgi:hypothetical protein|nr:DUF3105 domain-containing protein [Frankiaceae bacterium]